MRLRHVEGTVALTAEMATAVQNATNGLLSVFGQPRNTVPFQRFFELAGRGTGEGPLLVWERVGSALQSFMDIPGGISEGAAAVVSALIKHRGKLLGCAAASALAAEEAVNFIVGAE